VGFRENPKAVALIVSVDVLSPLSIKLTKAAGSINWPFTKKVKLDIVVGGSGVGAAKNPLGKIAVFEVTVVASTVLFVFKYVKKFDKSPDIVVKFTLYESENDVDPMAVFLGIS